jgi:predicted dehydrogenase
MAGTIRWGILGTGGIAKKFAEGLQSVSDAELAAVGSRADHTAKSFAKAFGIGHRHASYESLANDPDVDVVYVATPHPFHMENTLLCLNAGKTVLCEKPFAINTSQARKMIETAKSKKLFLMEAMWTRFLPIIVKVRQWLEDDVIGDVRMVQANFGFRADWLPERRWLNPELGGGALLDVGVYCISLASMIFRQPPQKIVSMAHLGQTGVDEQSAFIFSYDKGQLSVLTSAISTNTENHAIIFGTRGSIKIHLPFWCATIATLSIEGKDDKTVEMPLEGNGYNYQAKEVMNCMRAGKTQSKIMPLDETLSIMKTMDSIRKQWALEYPMEETDKPE